MKKITALLVIFMLLTSVGCTAAENDLDDSVTTASAVTTVPHTESTATTATTVPEVTETESAATSDTPAAEGLTVHTESFTSGECYVTLMYPIYGDGKHDSFDVAMYNYAMQKYTGSGMMPEEGAVYEITDCDITLETEHFVSAVVRGRMLTSDGIRDTVVAYTVNADTKNGRLYSAEDLIGDLDELKAAFADGRFSQNMGLTDVLSETAAEDIMQSWRSDYGVYPGMYFTEKSFGILPEVANVLGGYAGFVIPYADVGDMINPVAKGLCGIIVTTE